jgi:tellurite resistance protein
MNLREAIAHELERLGEDELELVLAFVSALASLDRQAETTELFRQMQELGKPADPATQRFREVLIRLMQELGELDDPVTQRFVEALLRHIREHGKWPDPVTQRAIVALWTARAIAKADGITDEDVLEEIQAYRASTALSTSPSSTQRSQSLGLGQ